MTMPPAMDFYWQALGPASAALFVSMLWPLSAQIWSGVAERRSAAAVNLARVIVALPVFVIMSVTIGAPAGEWFFGGIWSVIRWSNVLWLVGSVLCSFALADVLFLRAITRLGLPLAVAITSCYPVWSALAGSWWLGQRLEWPQWLGLAVILAGLVALVVGPQPLSIHTRTHSRAERWRGVGIALLASLLWGGATFCIAKGGAGLNAQTTSSIEMIIAMALCPLVGWIFGIAPRDLVLRRSEFLTVLPACLIGIATNLAYVYCLTRGVLAVSSALSALSPVFAVPVAWMVRREHFSVRQLGLIAIVTLGIVLLVIG